MQLVTEAGKVVLDEDQPWLVTQIRNGIFLLPSSLEDILRCIFDRVSGREFENGLS